VLLSIVAADWSIELSISINLDVATERMSGSGVFFDHVISRPTPRKARKLGTAFYLKFSSARHASNSKYSSA
jgi:hypothetical protein